ncbi:hypothetical protein BDV96DRAFT_593129 [Lophiotrema nucula]|uniref:Cell wall proline rich protein n=1 Tax=Lophiotrema nucula TaxID=690887 RepID=A0A6A5ZW57_9PLEO|nr:hypothetical protein BDV96DRAFT_593129 [Lophiotrema nucula]
MAQIALPRQQVTQTVQSTSDVGSPLYQRRRTSNAGPIELIPNPEFSFPQRGPDYQAAESVPAPNALPMSLQPLPTGRRGSNPGLRQKSVNALPDFSFNPAASTIPSTETSTLATPPLSPATTPTTPSRPIGGHRRGGSEFIGGDGRTGGVSLLSSSPTKGDGVLPPPNTTLRPGPPAGRRGHAHRRSGAVSSHDLSSIMNPAGAHLATRSGSAPVTPMEGEPFAFGHSVNKSMSQPSLRDNSFFPDDSNASPRRPLSRARVGFSDKVEYIRPLSTISSETETSLSTMRGGHSATGSISSVISAGASSPSSARIGRPSLNTTLEDEGRPSTAGAVLDKHINAHFAGDVLNRKRPMSAISPASPTVTSPVSPRVPAKRRGFFRLESRRSDTSISTIPTSVSDPALSSPMGSPLPSPMADDEEETAQGLEKHKSRKGSRKPRKVKSWANSIISRRGKHSSKPKGRAPTPPPEAGADAEDTDASEELDLDANFDANFDVDNTVTIVSPTEGASEERKATDIASWRPRELKRVDSDSMSPTIDLDAALGPFNTPHGSSPKSQQRGFGAHRRAMHSASGLVQNHRRTESAPALVPFELRSATAATTSTMADVFEEEEPEEDPSIIKDAHSPTIVEATTADELEEPKIQVVEPDHAHKGSSIKWDFDDGLRIRRGDRPRKQELSEQVSPRELAKPALLVPSRNASKQSLDVSPVEVVEDYEEPRTSSLTHSSDSTVTPQLPADDSKEIQPIMNLSLPLPQQTLMTPDTFTSSFSSPDFRSSQASLDTPRLGTSTSSVTEFYPMPSPHFGEPGPEVRISSDVPSLTSSRSTATNAFPVMSPRAPGDRSASLCSVPSDLESRRRKRSSIASLSRLIHGSTFGEKSKLSIEQRPHSEYLEPSKESKKKHKRLSKLMQFWKPKDASKA